MVSTKKRVLEDLKSDPLSELLNRDAGASAYMEEMLRDFANRHFDVNENEWVKPTAFSVGQFTGRWAERLPKQGIVASRDEHATLGALPYLFAELALKDQAFHIRRCQACNRWFLARRKDQQTCDAVCRHKKYEQEPQTKERQNAYMRWRYAMNDSRKWRDWQTGSKKRDQPKFEDWLKHKELKHRDLTPHEWEAKKKGRK